MFSKYTIPTPLTTLAAHMIRSTANELIRRSEDGSNGYGVNQMLAVACELEVPAIIERSQSEPPPAKTGHPLTVIEWAVERLENTVRIAATHEGAFRDGWLEDAAYWRQIVAALRSAEEARQTADAHV